jgi:hypothetical protein
VAILLFAGVAFGLSISLGVLVGLTGGAEGPFATFGWQVSRALTCAGTSAGANGL